MDGHTTAPARVRLGTWPTPLEPAPRLAAALGLRPEDLWIKRDDLTGLGGGGNKVRKLEYTCAAALTNGARTLVTIGAAQSNHARLTAAAGARLGLDVVLVLAGKPRLRPRATSCWTACLVRASSGPETSTSTNWSASRVSMLSRCQNEEPAPSSFRSAAPACWPPTAMWTVGTSCGTRHRIWLTSSSPWARARPWPG